MRSDDAYLTDRLSVEGTVNKESESDSESESE
jgi:hypothetical protein